MARIERDWQTYAGITVVALAAAVMSFAAWAALGTMVGIIQSLSVFGVSLYLSWLLPLSVDVYAVTTARVWLRSTTASRKTREFAKKSSIGAIAQSVSGNALYHLIVATDFATSDWWPLVVVLVSGIPAFQLGLALHLAALVARDRSEHRATDGHAPLDTFTAATTWADTTLDTAPAVSLDKPPAPKRTRRAPAKRTPKPAKKVDTAAAVLATRVQYPHWTHAAIAEELKVSTKTVSRHLAAVDKPTNIPAVNGTTILTGGE